MGVTRDRRQTRQRQETSPPKTPSPAIGLRDAGMWASIFCATLLAYLPALRGGLLWDDNMHVTRADLRSLHGLWRIGFGLGATQQCYPLLPSTFWFEQRIRAA